MACRTLYMADGGAIIVCGPRAPAKRCACGKLAPLLCDWKLGQGKTCDRPICREHGREVADDKHLCPEHQEAYRQWQAARERA